MADYIDADGYKLWANLADDNDNWEAAIAVAIPSACRAIDLYCGRPFSLADSATARVFPTYDRDELPVDDIGAAAGLVLETDDTDTGVFATTWSASDYELDPPNGVAASGIPWPYTQILACGSLQFPVAGRRRNRARVTAKWGFPAVPDDVIQGAYILTTDLYAMKDNKFGVIGSPDVGVVKIRQNTVLTSLLQPYQKLV